MYKGEITGSFHSCGNFLYLKNFVYSIARGNDRLSASSFNIPGCKLSAPGNLYRLRLKLLFNFLLGKVNVANSCIAV